MTLTDRDRKIALVAAPLLVVLVYWFLVLSPKREEASVAGETLAAEQTRLSEAETRAATLSAAKKNFAADYAAVVRLGKAVPSSVDMPSLLVQLEQAAKGTGIVFEKVAAGERGPIGESTSSAAAAATPAAPVPGQPGAPAAPAPGQPAPAGGAATPTAPSGQPAQSAPGAAAGSAEGAVDAANTGAAPAGDPAAPGATAPAAGAPAASPAGGPLEALALDFSFRGSFFELASFFHRLKRFVYVKGDNVRVRGRLMTIDSVQYATDPQTFPVLTAQVKASVFLTPKSEGVAAGATPSGPAPAPAAPAAQTSTASSGDAAAPAPTATATP